MNSTNSSDVYWSLGNIDKHQLQLDVHFGIENPMKEKIKMASINEEAMSYAPKKTHNISELEKVSVEIEMFDKIVPPSEKGEGFSYKYILVEEQEYRVPKPVLVQLKVQLKANPDLKFFKVVKDGEGKNDTTYTVIPLN